jgi:hypothetical protein
MAKLEVQSCNVRVARVLDRIRDFVRIFPCLPDPYSVRLGEILTSVADPFKDQMS